VIVEAVGFVGCSVAVMVAILALYAVAYGVCSVAKRLAKKCDWFRGFH
jgi:hypothetical protein